MAKRIGSEGGDTEAISREKGGEMVSAEPGADIRRGGEAGHYIFGELGGELHCKRG